MGSDGELDLEIWDLLEERPGLSARSIGYYLDVRKSAVNSILYRLQGDVFRQVDGRPPLWFLQDQDDRNGDEDSELDLHAWQVEALAAWNDNDRQGIVEAVTGSGKTRLAMGAIAEHLEAGHEDVVVIVPTVELLDQWYFELKNRFDWIAIGRLGDGSTDSLATENVVVATAHSAHGRSLDLREESVGLLIADECHHYGSDKFKNALKPEFANRLGLSATYERSDGAHRTILEPYFGGVVFTYPFSRAIEDEVVARFRVGLVPVQFDPVEQDEYDELTERYRKARTRLIKGFGVPEEPFEAFIAQVNAMRRSGTRAQGIAAGNFWSALTQRRKLLSNTQAKFDALASVAPAIGSADGALIFTETIQAAKRGARILQAEGLQAVAYYGSLDRETKTRILAAFQSRELDAVLAPKALDEGVDVPEADLAVIVAASQQRRQMIQRMGRVLRKKADQRVARFAILFVEGTSEDPERGAHEAFLDEMLEVASQRPRRFDSDVTADELAEFFAAGDSLEISP